MRLTSYAMAGNPRLGAMADGLVVDLARAFEAMPHNGSASPPIVMPSNGRDYLEAGPSIARPAADAVDFALRMYQVGGIEEVHGLRIAFAEPEVRLLPPVLEPRKIICLGINYRGHAMETGRELPVAPQLFAKFANSLIGPRDPIQLPLASDEVDIEAELAFVIGRAARCIAAEDAMDYVAGYAAFNDVSVRDFQRMTSQFTAGKIMDGSGPMGPLLTRDEIPNPHALRIQSWIDDFQMQDSNTSELVFNIPQIIAFVSQLTTLEPGDIVATGTPAGIGARRTPPIFLKPGQVAIVEIEGLGRLENTAVAPRASGVAPGIPESAPW